MGESCGEHCGLRKADIVEGLPEDGVVSIHCAPPWPPILGREVLQCPISSMQLPGELFSCLGEDRGQLEDMDMGSCLMVTPKKCWPIMAGVCWWCMEGWDGGGMASCVAP